MKPITLFGLAALAMLPTTHAQAASVCIISTYSDNVFCDGKRTASLAKDLEDPSARATLGLKKLIENGYRLTSESRSGEFHQYTLVKP